MTEIFYRMPADSETVVVSFGAKGGGDGVFHFFKVLKPLPGISKLLVRDPVEHWYNAGLPGVGETVEEIGERIRWEVDQLGGRRVVTLGPSMGAYAAILFGCMIGAERAIAMAPQTLLDTRLRHSPPADVPLQVPDLAPIIRDAPGTAVDIIAGWDDPVDVFHAQRVADLPSVRVLALRGGVHSFVGDLHSEGRLIPLIAELVGGGTPDGFEIDPQLDPDVEERIGDTAYAMEARDWETVADRVGPVAERFPQWAGPNFALGRAQAEMEDWPAVEIAQTRAVRAAPRWPQPRAFLIRALLEQKRPAEAESLARSGLAFDPDWAYGHLSLARCLTQQGRADEAHAPAFALPDHPEMQCLPLNDRLADLLIARTLDSDDLRLREMTRDLTRFSSRGELAKWRPGRDLLCLQDGSGSLIGIVWFAEKPLPERDDYFGPDRLGEHPPNLTCAIRTYGAARGRGLLTRDFGAHALAELLRRRPETRSVWYETKAGNRAARALGRQLGFSEVSGEAGGTVVGIRFFAEPRTALGSGAAEP